METWFNFKVITSGKPTCTISDVEPKLSDFDIALSFTDFKNSFSTLYTPFRMLHNGRSVD
jgi:hypothetical protein